MLFKDSNIVDIAGRVADLNNLWLLGVGGAAVVTGNYVDIDGNYVGVSISTTLSTTAPKRLDGSTIDNVGTIPASAVGFSGTITTYPLALAYIKDATNGAGAPILADFITNPTRYFQKQTSTAFTIGRVA